MKSFMKFLVTLLVIGLIGLVIGYLFVNGAKPRGGETPQIIPGEKLEEYEPITVVEPLEEESLGEEVIEIETIEEKIAQIDLQVSTVAFTPIEEGIHTELESGEVSQTAREFLEYFNVNQLGVIVCSGENAIEIIPNSDFIENMLYYYNNNGELILYESVSTTVGGSCKYYFEAGELLDTIVAYEEEKVEPKLESGEEIVMRAQQLYDMFLR